MGRQGSLFSASEMALAGVGGDGWESPNSSTPASAIVIRDYQKRTIDKIIDDLKEVRSTMVELATGTGKTVVFCGFVKRMLDDGAKRILIVVCRDEHVPQTIDKLKAILGESVWIETETQDTRATRDQEHDPVSSVVVAMVDTIAGRQRLTSFRRDEFDVIVFDECHHVVTSNVTYWSIHQYFQNAKILGVTAVAERSDGRSLGNAFEICSERYHVFDAILDGWLCPIVQQYVTCENYDLSTIKRSKRGEFNPVQLDELMRTESPLHGLCNAAVKYSNYGGDQRQTIIFTASAKHCELVAEILNRRHRRDGTGKAHYIVSKGMERSTRRRRVHEYVTEEVRYLVNYGTLVEGFDAAQTRVLMIGRPVTSEALYKQMLGRGLRPHPSCVQILNEADSAEARRAIIASSIKPSCFVGDLVGASEHKLAKDSLDVLGGWDRGEVVELARYGVNRIGRERVRVDLELLKAREEARKREAKRKREYVIDCEVSGRPVDPFNVFDLVVSKSPRWLKGRKPTRKMVETLKKAGFTEKQIDKFSWAKARSLLDEVFRRWDNGLCSFKQAKLLIKYGYDVANVSFDEAAALIDRIAKNGWQRPD